MIVMLQRIMTKGFVRLNPSNRGIYKGSGLGLTVVKEFIHDLGGEIDVESTVGKGSTFAVTLPFKKPLIDNASDPCWEDEKDSSDQVTFF